ncbi:MAG: hypothetical protein JWM77_2237 [Rhodospirillales bacterium]|jgi:hypothetical protein|nr:hypothetical protein [Rhodospirillales bacterium]
MIVSLRAAVACGALLAAAAPALSYAANPPAEAHKVDERWMWD